MSGNFPPKGLISVLVTPLDDKGDVDVQSLDNLVNHILKYVNGVLSGINLTGEGFLLSREKKHNLIESALKTVAGRVPLILGITGDSAEETIDNVSFLEKTRKELKYSGSLFLFDCPLWYHSNRGLPQHYLKLTKLTELPLVLYNNPHLISTHKGHLKRRNIRTTVLKKLSANEQVVGMKHSGDAGRSLNYLMAVRNRKGFVFYDGNELNFLNNPGPGGIVSGGANILPEDWKEIVESSLNPYDPRKEDPLYCRRLWEIGEKLKNFHLCYRSNPPAVIKTALKNLGVIKNARVVEGTFSITDEEDQQLDFLFREYGLVPE